MKNQALALSLIIFFSVCLYAENKDNYDAVTGATKNTDTIKIKGKSPEQQAREKMVETQIVKRGIKDKKVIDSMMVVPRHKFIPQRYLAGTSGFDAYGDYPVPIGEEQTISQPYIVALMTELLQLKGKEKVLEVGTGSGYQAAVLSNISGEVYTIEILKALYDFSANNLRQYKNVYVKHGDGYLGWPEAGPFDAIIVTCAPDHIPKPLIEQLKVGGRMVIPIGEYPYQELDVIEKVSKDKTVVKPIIPVTFVPMTGDEVEKVKE